MFFFLRATGVKSFVKKCRCQYNQRAVGHYANNSNCPVAIVSIGAVDAVNAVAAVVTVAGDVAVAVVVDVMLLL